MTSPSYELVIPTIGRPSLSVLLNSLARSATAAGRELPPIWVVDDRRSQDAAAAPELTSTGLPVTVLPSGGRGPAAARNVGWRRCQADWVVFLDDDVAVGPAWLAELENDLRDLPPAVAGVQARLSVPLPPDRAPRDWERSTAGLAAASWITADLAYRRAALVECGGFDERFPRAFREDSDLALRMMDQGWSLVRGRRHTTHPVRPAGWWVSVRQQRGNADDVLMGRLHGRGWRQRADAPLGRRPQHLLTTAAGLLAVTGAVTGSRRLAGLATAGWLASTAEFSWRRIAPGPRDRAEVLRMLSTSMVIPPAATWFWLRGLLDSRGLRRGGRFGHYRQLSLCQMKRQTSDRHLPAAVLLDRDGTLVRDVAYNGDPSKVRPMPGARLALDRLRQAGIPLAVISNQSGIGRGLITSEQVRAVNSQIEALLGPFAGWFVCPHTASAGCACRKPRPGLIEQAAAQLGVRPESCVVIGDIGSDVGSAAAAGARSILVPTPQTRREEVAAAPARAATLSEAVDLVLLGGLR